MTSSGARTLVRYKSLPTRESLRVRSPERTQYAYSSAPSSKEHREKKTTFATICKDYRVWIVPRGLSSQGAAHIARHLSAKARLFNTIPH